MGWRGAGGNGAAGEGTYFFFGGLLMTLGALGEVRRNSQSVKRSSSRPNTKLSISLSLAIPSPLSFSVASVGPNFLLHCEYLLWLTIE